MKQPTNPITPFAMRCTQEQFDDVKEELEKYQRIYSIFDFTRYPVLLLDNAGVTNTGEWYCRDTPTHLHHWDKSLFLKMAGKPDPESRELIGYKRNPKMDVTNEQLGKLLDCEIFEYNGFIWSGGKSWISPIPAYIRAVELNIVGEDKILVPVYREEATESNTIYRDVHTEEEMLRQQAEFEAGGTKETIIYKVDSPEPIPFVPPHPFNDQYRSMDTSPIPEHYFKQHLSDVTRITGTYEQQKGDL